MYLKYCSFTILSIFSPTIDFWRETLLRRGAEKTLFPVELECKKNNQFGNITMNTLPWKPSAPSAASVVILRLYSKNLNISHVQLKS